jgi:dUTP pyrophosphatase
LSEKRSDKVTVKYTRAGSGGVYIGYATPGSAGADVTSHHTHPIVLRPGERALVPTGLILELPEGVEAQVRPRSGLALKHGLTVLNAPGTIDSDFRGEVKVLLANLGNVDVTINYGTRIAQLVFARYEKVSFEYTNIPLSETSRGSGGFGSTGLQTETVEKTQKTDNTTPSDPIASYNEFLRHCC